LKFKIFLKHFKTVCTHKFWVMYYCFKFGLYWQGIVHDLSKFSYTEFSESVKYYTGTRSPIEACKEDKGYSDAWLHHKGRNKHHYEYWQDNFDNGTTHLEMPFKYVLEMLCDNIAASRTYNGKDFSFLKLYEWWIKVSPNRHAMPRKAYKFIGGMINVMKEREEQGRIKEVLPPFFYKKKYYDMFENMYNERC